MKNRKRTGAVWIGMLCGTALLLCGAAVALYGHTHNAAIEEIGGVTLVCPGTMKFPLYAGGTYAYLVICGDKCTVTIVGE